MELNEVGRLIYGMVQSGRICLIETERKNMEQNRKNIMFARVGLLALGIILVVTGICTGGYTDIMNKAIRICYECIGIG